MDASNWGRPLLLQKQSFLEDEEAGSLFLERGRVLPKGAVHISKIEKIYNKNKKIKFVSVDKAMYILKM